MAGRFVIRRDHLDGTFRYMARDYEDRSLRRVLSEESREKPRWITVYRPEEATRFWNRDAAEAAIFLLAVEDLKWDYSYSVREWDGSRWKNP